MPKDITGSAQTNLDLTVTIPVNGDTSDAMRIDDLVQALLNNDATLRDVLAGDITSVTAGTGLSGGGSTGAVSIRIANGGVATALIADDAITNAKIADDAIDATKLDTTNTGTTGQILELGASDQMTWVEKPSGGQGGGGDITEVRAGTGLSGGSTSGVATLNIANGGVTATQLASNAVTGIKIANGAVTGAKIASNAITISKINDRAVTNSKIANNAVNTAQITNDAVDATKLDTTNTGATGQILELGSSNQMTWVAKPSTGITIVGAGRGLSANTQGSTVTLSVANGGINTTQLANNAVTAAKIANSTITTTQLANNAVETTDIKDDAVTSAKILNNAITAAKINSNAVTTAKINNEAVTEAKLDISNSPTAGQFLQYKDGTDQLTWATAGGATITDIGWTPARQDGSSSAPSVFHVRSSRAFRIGNLVFISVQGQLAHGSTWQNATLYINLPYDPGVVPLNQAFSLVSVDVATNYLEATIARRRSIDRILVFLNKTARNATNANFTLTGFYKAA